MDQSSGNRPLSPISEEEARLPALQRPHDTAPPSKRPRLEAPFTCTLCALQFKYNKSLLRHNRSPAHLKKAGLPSDSNLSCEHCPTKVFSNNYTLERHIDEQHRGNKRAPARRSGSLQQNELGGDTPRQPPGQSQRASSVLSSYHINPSIEQVLANNTLDPALTLRDPQGSWFLEPLEAGSSQFWAPQFPFGPLEIHGTPALWESHESNGDSMLLSEEAFAVTSTEPLSPSSEQYPAATNSNDCSSVPTVESSAEASPAEHSLLSELGSSVAISPTEHSPLSTEPSPEARADIHAQNHTRRDHSSHHQPSHALDVRYRSATPVLKGKNVRPYRLLFPRPCPLCRQEFGCTVEDGLKVRQHIEAHMTELNARESGDSKVKIWCPDCELQFCHIGDLEWHLQSVERDGTCGFKFAHADDSLCVGHHPPMLDGQRHDDHQNFSVCLLAWEAPQYKEFDRYVKDFAQGYVPTNAPPPACNTSRPAFRRSTGSLFSTRSQASWFSYLSAPWYMGLSKEPMNSRFSIASGSLQQVLDPARRIQEHISRAMELGQPEVIKQLIEHPGSLKGKISEASLPFTIDASWFGSHIPVKRVWCLAVLVEHGMPISVNTVGYLATACQDKRVLRLLLTDGRYMNITSRLTLCVLCSAICNKQADVVLDMLNCGVRVSPLNHPQIAFMETLHEQHAECRYSPRQMGLNWTTDYPLALALDVKDYMIADRLIQHGSNAYNTLIRAAQITDLAALGFLCDRDVHLQSQPVRQRSGVCGSPDVLHLLAHSMQCSDRPAGPLLDSARTLVTRNIDVNGRDSMRRTTLMIICGMSNMDSESDNSSAQILAEMLIRGGADVNARDKFYRTPLIHAAIAGNIRMTKLILSKDPAIDRVDHEGQSAVLHALSRNNRHIAELLIKRQGVPTVKVFDEALRSDHRQLACFLLRPSMGDNFGTYSQEDQTRLMSALLEFGDETNTYHVRVVTFLASSQPKSALRLPLQEALSNGRVAFTNSLLQKGAPTKQADIFLALKSKNPDTVDLLFDRVQIQHVHDAEGRTPLIAAISVECSRSVSSLLQRHVDVNGMGSGKDTPLKVAYDMGLKQSNPIVMLLKEFGGRLVASPDRWSRQSRDERLIGGFLKPFGRQSIVLKGITRYNIIRRRHTLTMPQSIAV